MEEEDYSLSFESFEEKVAKLEMQPPQKAACTREYVRRQSQKITTLASENQSLASDNQIKSEKITTLCAENEKLAQEATLNKAIQSLTVGAPSTIFNYITNLGPASVQSKTCHLEKIVDCWRQCRNSSLMPDLGAVSSRVEEKCVQAAFTVGIRIIVSNLHYNHSLTEEKKVCGSNLKPDLVLAQRGVTNPGFRDVLALVELKSPGVPLKDAVVQAAQYLADVSQQKFSQNQSLSSLVAIGSNYTDICIFGFPGQNPLPVLQLCTGTKSFLPAGWKNLEIPTDGFIELCHAIHQTGDSSSKCIEINDVDVIITSTIYEMEGVGVYRCTYQNQDLVVKQGYGKRGKGLVEHELEKFKVVWEIKAFQPYLLPWKEDLRVQHGFVMPFGTVIIDECYQNESFLIEQYRWLIQGLKILHGNNLYHLDIRPGNIIVYDNSARLIDWFTLQRDELFHAWLRQGHDDPFWPVHRDKFNDKSLFYLWDLISLGYTFLFIAVKDVSDRLRMQDKRFDFMQNLLADPSFVGKLARTIQYLETAPVDLDKNLLYETCLSTICTQEDS